jgi:aryl-alcohol dehydrogenase-like predicted oxidoreductase
MLNKHPAMITIPGTTQVAHMQDNFTAGHIQLDTRSINAVEALLDKALIKGNRYNAQARSEVDTEEA